MTDKPNPFKKRPETITRFEKLGQGDQVIVVTQAYGPNGESLMDESDYRFSGEVGIKIRVRQGDLEDDVLLSPFFGDPSKVHTAPFKDGVRCELLCAKTGAPLDEVTELSDSGKHYYAVYLSKKLGDGETVIVNDVWGDTSSRLMSEAEMLSLFADISEASVDG